MQNSYPWGVSILLIYYGIKLSYIECDRWFSFGLKQPLLGAAAWKARWSSSRVDFTVNSTIWTKCRMTKFRPSIRRRRSIWIRFSRAPPPETGRTDGAFGALKKELSSSSCMDGITSPWLRLPLRRFASASLLFAWWSCCKYCEAIWRRLESISPGMPVSDFWGRTQPIWEPPWSFLQKVICIIETFNAIRV